MAPEGTVRDCPIDPKEASAVAALRAEPGVTMPEHAAIEREVRVGLGPAVPAPTKRVVRRQSGG